MSILPVCLSVNAWDYFFYLRVTYKRVYIDSDFGIDPRLIIQKKMVYRIGKTFTKYITEDAFMAT